MIPVRVGPATEGTRMALVRSARWLPVVLIAAVGAVGLFVAAAPPRARTADPRPDPTADYIARLDVARFERNGTRYTDPDLSPYRILPTLTPHDITYHYDFAKLAAAQDRLRGVHRRTALKALFDRVTAGADTPTDRHRAVLRFLHKAAFHNLIQPATPTGQPVLDPLVLLELGEMRCGHVNRVAVDLFRSAGMPARLVQAAYHILAEVWYDGGWHYFDGDIFGNGETAVLPDGRIPSMAELSRRPELLDRLTAYWEPSHQNAVPSGGREYPSWYYFAAPAYAACGASPVSIEKVATAEQEDRSRLYGWEHYASIPESDRRLTAETEPRRTPGPPVLTEVRWDRDGQQLTLAWAAAKRAVGYRVFVGRSSRGWNYDGPSLPPELMRFKSGHWTWRPEMYEPRYRLPPADLAFVDTTDLGMCVRLPADGPAYVTVMPYDAYGESVGRRLYPVTEELRVR